MKARVREVAHRMQEVVGHVRTWLDPRLDAAARPLEVQEAIVDHVESRVEPAGRGRRVLPYNHVSIAVLAPDRERRAALDAALSGLESAVMTRLAELRCEAPPGFALDVEYVKRPRPGWDPGQWIDIEYGRSPGADRPPARADLPLLCITVVRGTATQPSYTLSERHILIGRTPDPVDQRGRTRHNHVVFVEDGDECSRTVGRAHASIRYVPDRREYRLFDEGSRNGTRLVRNGEVLEVVPRDPVGVALLSGDEIRFGTTAVQVRVDPVRGDAGRPDVRKAGA